VHKGHGAEAHGEDGDEVAESVEERDLLEGVKIRRRGLGHRADPGEPLRNEPDPRHEELRGRYRGVAREDIEDLSAARARSAAAGAEGRAAVRGDGRAGRGVGAGSACLLVML